MDSSVLSVVYMYMEETLYSLLDCIIILYLIHNIYLTITIIPWLLTKAIYTFVVSVSVIIWKQTNHEAESTSV